MKDTGKDGTLKQEKRQIQMAKILTVLKKAPLYKEPRKWYGEKGTA